jgi:hypothetical protein
MIYCFDLDGTLCSDTNGQYEKAEPYPLRIIRVNELYDMGHRIIINSARGSTTKWDWYDVTKKQLKEWGVRYDELYVGKKIDADVFVDDKAVSDRDFFAPEINPKNNL